MKRINQIIVLAMLVVMMPGCNTNSSSTATRVEIKKNESGYHRLFVNKQEFFVEGAGLSLATLKHWLNMVEIRFEPGVLETRMKMPWMFLIVHIKVACWF